MNANLLIFKKDPLDSFILAALCLILEKNEEKCKNIFKGFWKVKKSYVDIQYQSAPRQFKVIKSMKQSVRRQESGVEKALRLTLVLYVLGILIIAYH